MTGAPAEDPLWPEFKPLWTSLHRAEGPLLVAGGYGLFLKQHWLLSEPSRPTVVPVTQWLDPAPRVTKDVDIVVSLELIASEAAQAIMAQAMSEHLFETLDPRWQFRKRLGENRDIFVEFHAYPPPPGTPHIDMDKYRVKHKPSLGEEGIHGRQNPEAIGGDLHPCTFDIDGIALAVPNPVTWCIMKLVAMADRWQKTDEARRPEEFRAFQYEQAVKHARDVCRAIALTTAEERDRSRAVIQGIQATPEFQKAARIGEAYFSEGGRATQVIRPLWAEADVRILRETLTGWFPPP